jgi:dTDP-4-dehydrorhamnose reductase
MKPLVIFGAAGQVGRSVTRLAVKKGMTARGYVREEVDITQSQDIARAIEGAGFVINCAAYTAVDKAESEPAVAFAVNATAPGVMATACREQDIPLLHISTDYVFGEPIGRPWREEDAVAPLNVYGHSKAAGESAVQGAWHKHLILRTAWVYDSEGKNFVLTMLRLARDRPELSVVGDQQGGPTSAQDIAQAILHMVETASDPAFTGWGIYHFTGAPATTWFDFATAIFGDKGPRLTRITTADYPTPARRSPYSVLDCSKIAAAFGIRQPDWHKSLDKVLEVVGNPR